MSDRLRIDASEEKLHFRANGDLLAVDIEVKKGDEPLLNLEVKELCRATFSLSYLRKMVDAVKDLEVAKLEYASDMPLKVWFELDGGKLTYWLAPRIEVD